jgi:hypothetical protein
VPQYQCHWCGRLVEQESAVVYQRRNAFDNWLGNDYYHQACYPKYLQRQEEINKQEEKDLKWFKLIPIIIVVSFVVITVIPLIQYFLLPH